MLDPKNPWRRKTRKVVFDGPWMQVRDDRVVRADGSSGPYSWVHFKNVAVAILALDEKERAILVGQWRYTLDAYSWEIPAGGCPADAGETIEDTAQRELREETGLQAGRWELLGRGHLSNSITDEATAMFLATDLEPVASGANPEPTEELALRWVTLSELDALIDRGEITDGLTLTTVLRFKLRRGGESAPGGRRRGTDSPTAPR